MEPGGRNRWQMGGARKPLKQADPQPVATHGNGFEAHGKEGVDGSSPSEGFSLQSRFSRRGSQLVSEWVVQKCEGVVCWSD